VSAQKIAYAAKGFITVRNSPLRVPLSGSLVVHADPDSGRFTGDLVLEPSAISWRVPRATLFTATVQITATSPAIGQIDHEGRLTALATVDAVIADVRAAGQTLVSDGSCRTATQALVPLRSAPGFSLERGGRLEGTYQRPPFIGCGAMTPLINLLISGSGNGIVIDLAPLPAQRSDSPSPVG
jgi:hypothetical protein